MDEKCNVVEFLFVFAFVAVVLIVIISEWRNFNVCTVELFWSLMALFCLVLLLFQILIHSTH